MNKEEVLHLASEATILMARYKEAVEQMSIASSENINKLTEAIKSTEQQVKEIIQRSDNTIAREANSAIESSLAQHLVTFQEKLNYSSDKILQESQQLVELKTFLAQRTKILTWKAITVFTIAIMAIIGISLKIVWDSKSEYQQLQDAINRAEISLEIKEALQKVEITSCGGTPCIKTDSSSKKWGKDGEYILIE